MVFSSLIFISIFLPVVMAVYYLLRPLPIWVRNVWLFVVSLVFYAWGEPYHIFLLLISIVLNYGFGLLLSKFSNEHIRKIILWVSVFSNLGILFVFKYLGFAGTIINKFFHADWKIPSVALPIGISFFTFQALSYVLDIYRKTAEADRNPLNVGLYISFFPQLIAGPIVRYSSISEQIKQRRESLEGVSNGLVRFLVGFSKKVLIANVLGNLADQAFNRVSGGNTIGTLTAWVGAVFYSLQIFYDFSGYSDMAIGLGRIFGFAFEENFNYPYAAESVTDFWRRWHISLSRWFRDYVYIPLGGSRVPKPRLILNLFVVWLLTGIWHGADWTFLFWGIWYFLFLSMEKMTGLPGKTGKNIFLKIAYRIFTLLVVVLGWVLFRSAGIRNAIFYIKTMFCPNSYSNDLAFQLLHEGRWALILGIIFSVPVLPWLKEKQKKKHEGNPGYLIPLLCVILFAAGISYLVMDYYNPFIYFNF